MRISDWSSDVCSSDLPGGKRQDRSRQAGKGGEAVDNLAVHRVAAPLLLLVCASSAGTLTPYSGIGGAASSCCADACPGTAALTTFVDLNGCFAVAVE